MVHAAALSLRIVRCRAWDGSQALGRTRGSELDLSRLEGSGALRVVLSLSLFCNARVALALHSFWESRIFAKYCINHLKNKVRRPTGGPTARTACLCCVGFCFPRRRCSRHTLLDRRCAGRDSSTGYSLQAWCSLARTMPTGARTAASLWARPLLCSLLVLTTWQPMSCDQAGVAEEVWTCRRCPSPRQHRFPRRTHEPKLSNPNLRSSRHPDTTHETLTANPASEAFESEDPIIGPDSTP